jgi:hypothetical protein
LPGYCPNLSDNRFLFILNHKRLFNLTRKGENDFDSEIVQKLKLNVPVTALEL